MVTISSVRRCASRTALSWRRRGCRGRRSSWLDAVREALATRIMIREYCAGSAGTASATTPSLLTSGSLGTPGSGTCRSMGCSGSVLRFRLLGGLSLLAITLRKTTRRGSEWRRMGATWTARLEQLTLSGTATNAPPVYGPAIAGAASPSFAGPGFVSLTRWTTAIRRLIRHGKDSGKWTRPPKSAEIASRRQRNSCTRLTGENRRRRPGVLTPGMHLGWSPRSWRS